MALSLADKLNQRATQIGKKRSMYDLQLFKNSLAKYYQEKEHLNTEYSQSIHWDYRLLIDLAVFEI